MARDAALKRAWVYLCAVYASLLLLGCSNRNDPGTSEPATVESQSLTGPVVITLSSPSTLSPIAPVLLGANGATVNSSANVVAGTVVAKGTSGFSAGACSDLAASNRGAPLIVTDRLGPNRDREYESSRASRLPRWW